ncbi:hypothetical protein ABEF93_005144 [Exophiala dermatitidis]
MQVVWEADTAAFASRKRAARACPKCRAAKKRCHHTFQRPPEQQADSAGLDRVLPNLTHKEPIRFVGDTNPESILTDLSSRPNGETRISRVGTWVQQPRTLQDELPAEDLGPQPKSGDKTPVNVEKYGKSEGGRRTLTGHQRNYLQAVGAFRVLPKATQDALITTYIACLDGLLPILDGVKLLKDYTDGRCSIFLIQAICLVTCKTQEAAPYLRLYDNGPLLDPIPFARSLHTGLDAAMKADLEPDRVTKIQILTLMHLHNDGPGGIEDSSLHLALAIHDAWTAGLHIMTPGRSSKDSYSLLWWTIWTLDKINACLGGRPIMIANRDIDITRPPMEAGSQLQVINLWLRLGDLLDQVIEFYRPTADLETTGWESEFPTYASLTHDINLDQLPESEKNILELCYRVIAILSCRAGGPTTASYARRVSAANRIQELLSNGRHSHIPPIPLVPYAVGLSLTVAYRCLRDNADVDPEKARSDLATRCETLETLSTYWWTADAMARLGRKALKSLQQPGMRKHSIANISNAMDAEVAVCKFGPFEPKAHTAGNAPTTNLSTPHLAGQDGEGNTGNALQVLSDAAARHSTQPPHQHPPQKYGQGQAEASSTTTSTSPSLTFTPSTITTSEPAAAAAAAANTRASNNPSQQRSYPATTPANINSATSMAPPTSGSGHGHSNPHSQGIFGAVASSASPGMSPSTFDDQTQAQNQSQSQSQYQYQFDDLDNLFEGFFDLSMPTIFQDPLFDGDAFLSADLNFAAGDEGAGAGGMLDTMEVDDGGSGVAYSNYAIAGHNNVRSTTAAAGSNTSNNDNNAHHQGSSTANTTAGPTGTTATTTTTTTAATKPRGASGSIFPDILLN